MKRPLVLLAVFLLPIAACGSADTEPGAEIDDTATTNSEPPPAEPSAAATSPETTLEVTVAHPDADDIVYTITCLDDVASITGDVQIDEAAACTALTDEAVQTRLVDGVPADQICTEIYGGPDTAHIVGTLGTTAIDTTIDRANGCGIDDWDRLFTAILPPALGITEGA